MNRPCSVAGTLCGLLSSFLGATGSMVTQADEAPYPAMAPLARYLEASEAEEIALARSAAPSSISANADVLTLSKDGYKAVTKGTNGFVCLVERSWATGLAYPGFWDPKFRAPTCYNLAAARTVLPRYIERTGWVLAGVPKPEMIDRTRAEVAATTFVLPEAGAMSYMMSKQTHLSDADGHWHPHLMFYLANTQAGAWGANLNGSPVYADGSTIFAQGNVSEPVITFFVPVTRWSDSTPEDTMAH